jgi:hypothetical protein
MKRRVGKTGRRTCGTYPDKVRYRDHESAAYAAMSIREHHPDRNQLPVRVYECPCGGWHLTSSEEWT